MRQTIRYLLLAMVTLFAHAASAQDKPGDYQLGPGDNIRIVVFRNADLTLETRVSESGSITYPLIGAIGLGGLTIGAAESRIAKALKDGGFLEQPQVNIILLQVRGNQIVVLGQVGRPGRYPLETNNMHLSDILSLAGGIAPGGADVVIVTGNRDGKAIRQEIDIPGIFLDKHGQNDIKVVGGDILYIHRAPTYYVYGEVQRPGSYRVERGMFVMQALAQAGGLTLRGTERRLRLYRRNGKGILESLSPEMTTEVKADDVIYVNESLF
jgi:polysaccharide biosynthesis/export protein